MERANCRELSWFRARFWLVGVAQRRSRPRSRRRGPAASGPVAVVSAPSALLDHDWGERTLSRVPVSLELPDARAWHARASGSFTELEHGPTQSTLILRLISRSGAPRAGPEECEADARLARPSLPHHDPSDVVEQRTLASPAGFDTRLLVGVEPRPNERVRGIALAIGAATGFCYVAAFETESGGRRAAEDVADRLALVVSGVLETVPQPGAERRRARSTTPGLLSDAPVFGARAGTRRCSQDANSGREDERLRS